MCIYFIDTLYLNLKLKNNIQVSNFADIFFISLLIFKKKKDDPPKFKEGVSYFAYSAHIWSSCKSLTTLWTCIKALFLTVR